MASGFGFSLAAARQPSPSTNGKPFDSRPQQNGVKRSHAALGDDSDDEGTPSKQVVTHFNAKGAFDSAAKPKEEKKALVIAPQANRDWREASKTAQAQKRARYGLPTESAEVEAKNREEEIKRLENANKPTFGLNVKARNAEDHEEAGPASEGKPTEGRTETESEPKAKVKTDDERALEALLGIQEQSDLTIPAANEEEAFQRDYKDAPPMATLAQYAATPVEEFGAALLRGMGWKEGHGIGKEAGRKLQKAKVVERRPALLGIGAKEDAAIKEELGAWGRGSRKGKPEQVYNPVIMRNKRTGEEVTEEEMRERVDKDQTRQIKDGGSRREEEDRDHRRSEQRTKRDDYSDEEYERRKREKRRQRDDYSDAEYERRRREKRREREDEGDRDRKESRNVRERDDKYHRADSRDKDRGPYSSRDDRKERDRDRDRYSERRRDDGRDRHDRHDRNSDYDRRKRY